MTISNTSRIAGPFLGNGVTTDFPFGFKVFGAADMQVVQTIVSTGAGGELVLNLQYYVTLNADQNANPGGTIKILTAPPTGASVVITSNMAVTQTLDLTNQGGFYPTVINSALDRVVILIQQIYATLLRTVRFPLSDGSTVTELPSAGARAGKLLGFDASGNFTAVVPAAGSAAAVLTQLSTSSGASLLGFLPGGIASVQRNVQSKLRERVSLFDFGCVGDDVVDDSVGIQNAINFCQLTGAALYVPTAPVAFRATVSLNMNRGIRVIGDGVEPMQEAGGVVTNNRGKGSWFHFDHVDKGFNIINGAGNFISGVAFRHIGTFRNHATPNGSAAWSATAADYDFYLTNSDFFMDDCVLLNPFQGIFSTKGGAGRLSIRHLRMQAMSIGINIDESYDVCQLIDIHQWPFWSLAPSVQTYTRTYLKTLVLARCDNPMIVNFFSIRHLCGITIANGSAGTTTKLKASNIDLDIGGSGIQVAAGVVGHTAQWSNVSMEGTQDTVGNTSGIAIAGSSCEIQFLNLAIHASKANSLRIDGTGNVVHVDNAKVSSWDLSVGNYPAFEVAVGNTLSFSKMPRSIPATGSPALGGAGTIMCPLTYGVSTLTTDASGQAIFAHGAMVKPRLVSITIGPGSAAFVIKVVSTDATNVSLLVYKQDGTPLASTSVTFSWDAKY